MNYQKKFIEKIKSITGCENFEVAIKMMNPNKFKYVYDTEKCICTHDIKKYYIFTFEGKEYKIGCDCVKRHPEFKGFKPLLKKLKKKFYEEQKREKILLEQKYEQVIYNIENLYCEYVSNPIFKEVEDEIKLFNSKITIKQVNYTIKDLLLNKNINLIKWLLENYYKDPDKKKALKRLCLRQSKI